MTKLHARSLPVGATKLISLMILPREFQFRRVGTETPSVLVPVEHADDFFHFRLRQSSVPRRRLNIGVTQIHLHRTQIPRSPSPPARETAIRIVRAEREEFGPISRSRIALPSSPRAA